MQSRIVNSLSGIGWARALIRISLLISTALIFISFPTMLIIFIAKGLYTVALKLAVSAAVPFLLVSGARILIDRPRPYEAEGFSPLFERKRGGRSFPSRHALSASVISTLWFGVGIPVAIFLSVCTLIICATRYLLGVHYISDLAVGVAVGIISGVIGIVLL